VLKFRRYGRVEARLIITIIQYTLPKSTLYCQFVFPVTFTNRELVYSVKQVARIVHCLVHPINQVKYVLFLVIMQIIVLGVTNDIEVLVDLRPALSIEITALIGLTCLLVET